MKLFLLLLICSLLRLEAKIPSLDQLVFAAENGDLAAKVSLAHRCLNSSGNTRDPDIIYGAFSEGAEAGLADAYAGLAICNLQGFGTDKDRFKAYRLARLSADLGSASGYYALAVTAMRGGPVSAMRDKLQDYLQKAVELGSLRAKFILASYEFTEGGFSQKIVDLRSLAELAELGFENAIMKLYRFHRNQNSEKAGDYLQMALASGFPEAHMSQIFGRFPGQSFQNLDNTREENEDALVCYRKAALRGDRGAIFQHAYGIFLHPELTGKDEDWREIMEEAARLGSIEACDILAWSYYKPTEPGVEPDYAKAESLLLRTLDLPNLGRYNTLGMIYADGGHGVEKNPERAFKLLGRFADQTPYVYRILGKILTDWEPLIGNEACKIRAYACYLRYQEMVPEPRKGLFEERTKALGLTAAQIAEARELADDGYPTKPQHTLWAAEDGPYAPGILARDAVAAYRENGKAAMTALLDERFTELHIARPRHPELFSENRPRYFRLFKEAQIGSGREDTRFAADLYGWLFENAEKYPTSFSRFGIINNYITTLSQSGQRAKAKVLLNQMAEILALSGFDTNLDSHPENRCFEDFPLVNSPVYQEVNFFGLDHASFLTQLSNQALVEGRWKDALAQAHAHFNVVLHKCESDPSIKNQMVEWRNRVVASRRGQASVFDLLQFHDRADKLHFLNSDDEYSKSYGGRSRHTGKVYLARNRILRGEVDEKLVNQLKDLVKMIARHKLLNQQSRFKAQHVLVLALFELGREEEAWSMLEELRKEGPHQLMFNSLWVKQKLAAGKLDGLEDLLISQLRWVRGQGEKVSELQLHFLYADFLKASGRLDEAIRVQLEAVRLLKSFDLYTLLPGAQLDLADLYALVGNLGEAKSQRAKAEKILTGGRAFPDHLARKVRGHLSRKLPAPGEDDEVPALADLQPKSQLCVPLEGFAAHGLFLLMNPARHRVKGQLQVTGVHRELTMEEGGDSYRVVVDSSQGIPTTSPLNFTLEAGEKVFLKLSTDKAGFTRKGELKIRWIPEKGPMLESVWTYEPAEADGVQKTVVDAGLYSHNPFYSIPIYHLIQSKVGFLNPVDLKITASHGARIEVYDEKSQLVFVDQNGDGNLFDQGDLLVLDENSDGHGDLKVDRTDARSTLFLIQVTPKENLPDDGLTVHVRDRGPTGRWEEAARDLILPLRK
ncbi:MAG: TPR repeat protein [Akkermansiaceae bacterium]|jgi:TPR repeat protein/tetratricopeptide (TPR) repeat protein